MPSKTDGNGQGLDRTEGSLDGIDESRNFLLEMRVLAAIGCLVIFLYSLRFWASGQLLRIFGVGMLVAGAALLTGFLLGFIFAIPRVGDKKGKTAAEPDSTQALDSGGRHGSVPFNANLVEISDWLTKIIVGVGLVELHSLPAKLGRLSYYLAPGLQPAACAGNASCVESLASGQAAGLAILIFYFALGFLLGYVWTMIYFQGDLERQVKHLELVKNILKRQVVQVEQQKDTLKQQKDALTRLERTANQIMTAEAFATAGQLDKAMDSVDDAIRSEPQNGIAVMTKARILKRQALQPGQPDRDKLLKQALALADQAVALLPNVPELIYNKACYEALLGLKGAALESLKSTFRLNPDLRRIAKDDDDFDLIRQDADFVKLTGQI